MRIRTIKPEWLDDERIVLSGSDARVLSVALILLADDYGNGRGNHQILGARIFPEDPRIFSEASRKLVDVGFIEYYKVDEQVYYSVRNWEKHQKVDKPGKPHVPGPSKRNDRVNPSPENIREDDENIPGSPEKSSPGSKDLRTCGSKDLRIEGSGSSTHSHTLKDSEQPPEQFTDPSQDREWMRVVELYSEIVGFPNEPYALQRESESILRLAKQMDDKSYLEIVQRALKSWWADDWVQEKRLPLSNLVKNFGKFAGANGKKSAQGLNYADQMKLTSLSEHMANVRKALTRAKENGDQVAIDRHAKKLKSVEADIAKLESGNV
jgi:hypothetical protein